MSTQLPAFKFLTAKYARNFLDSGEMRITPVFSFGDPSQYKGTIFDSEEGTVRLLYPPNFDEPEVLHCSNYLVYCASQYFFTETTLDLLKNGNDTCVLIKDFGAFSKTIDRNLDAIRLVQYRPCHYMNKDIRVADEEAEYLANMLKEESVRIAFIKPMEYKDQFEIRSAWELNGEERFAKEPMIVQCPSIKPLLIPMYIAAQLKEIDNIDIEHGFSLRINFVDGSYTDNHLYQPGRLFSPVIWTNFGVAMLGFRAKGQNTLYRVILGKNELDVALSTASSLILFNNKLEKIKSIYVSIYD